MSGKSKAICILGMHRSGTSTITRAMNLLGVDLGNPRVMLPPAKSNPKGFWEYAGIVKVHQKILRALYRNWDTTRPLPDQWWLHPKVQPYRAELTRLIRRNFSGKRIWGFKDPRTCLFIPLWQSIFKRLNIDASYVIVVRNPLDVAVSLQKRNGFSFHKSWKMWTLYTLSALKETENTKRTVIQYEAFLNDWETVLKKVSKAVDIPWPKHERRLQKAMNDFIEPDLQHSSSSFETLKEARVPSLVVKTYQACLRAEKNAALLRKRKFSNHIHKLYQQFRESMRRRGTIAR